MNIRALLIAGCVLICSAIGPAHATSPDAPLNKGLTTGDREVPLQNLNGGPVWVYTNEASAEPMSRLETRPHGTTCTVASGSRYRPLGFDYGRVLVELEENPYTSTKHRRGPLICANGAYFWVHITSYHNDVDRYRIAELEAAERDEQATKDRFAVRRILDEQLARKSPKRLPAEAPPTKQ